MRDVDDTTSKIRARRDTRNEQLYTGHAVHRARTGAREQQVCRQNMHESTRPGPVSRAQCGWWTVRGAVTMSDTPTQTNYVSIRFTSTLNIHLKRTQTHLG